MGTHVCLNDPDHVFIGYIRNGKQPKFCCMDCLYEYRRNPEVIRKRFWDLVDMCEHGRTCRHCCWPCAGSVRVEPGYINFFYVRDDGSHAYILAHRMAYFYSRKIPISGLDVCHTCDNPPCCNPYHLFAGTNYDNVMDKVSKQRQQMGTRVWNSKLCDADIPVIAKMWWDGHSCGSIGRMYGVCDQVVLQIAHGKSWKHVKR